MKTIPEPLIAIDFWNGTIGYEPKGEGGFGYDPFFIVTPDGKTAAQMTAEEKNASQPSGGKAMRKAHFINRTLELDKLKETSAFFIYSLAVVPKKMSLLRL